MFSWGERVKQRDKGIQVYKNTRRGCEGHLFCIRAKGCEVAFPYNKKHWLKLHVASLSVISLSLITNHISPLFCMRAKGFESLLYLKGCICELIWLENLPAIVFITNEIIQSYNKIQLCPLICSSLVHTPRFPSIIWDYYYSKYNFIHFLNIVQRFKTNIN